MASCWTSYFPATGRETSRTCRTISSRSSSNSTGVAVCRAEEEAAHAADISWTPPEEEEEESEPEEEPEPGDSADNSSGLADDY